MPTKEELEAMGQLLRDAKLKSWHARPSDTMDELSYEGQKWQHKFETLSESGGQAEDELAMYGAQGWELVTIDFATRTAYFKRKAL
jgi:hypothetical protein